MLKVIEIEHIKGIQQKRFVLDISPNKPSLLVAPRPMAKFTQDIARAIKLIR